MCSAVKQIAKLLRSINMLIGGERNNKTSCVCVLYLVLFARRARTKGATQNTIRFNAYLVDFDSYLSELFVPMVRLCEFVILLRVSVCV